MNSKTAVISAVLIGALGWALTGCGDNPNPADRQPGPPYPAQSRPPPMRPTQLPQAQGGGARHSQPQSGNPGIWSAPDQFHFRPLNERERGRYDAYPGRRAQDDAASPPWSKGDAWAQDGYRFRPIKPNPGGGTRWETPYPGNTRGPEPGTSGQWADQLDPPPWGSPAGQRPPALPMLPSLDRQDNRTFTAR